MSEKKRLDGPSNLQGDCTPPPPEPPPAQADLPSEPQQDSPYAIYCYEPSDEESSAMETELAAEWCYTDEERAAIRKALVDAHLKPDADWDEILFDIVNQVDLRMTAAPEAVLHESTVRRRLGAVRKALAAFLQKWEQLGPRLQWHLDDQGEIYTETSDGKEFAAAVEQWTGEHQCPSPGTGRLNFREVAEKQMAAVQRAMERPNPHLYVQQLGTPKHQEIRLLVDGLLDLFEEVTGTPPTIYASEYEKDGYDGNFYPFAVAVLAPTGLVPAAIGAAVLAVYNEWRKRRFPTAEAWAVRKAWRKHRLPNP